MKCIIPLAGPDIYTEKYGLKPLYEIEGRPLLKYVLNSRPWFSNDLEVKDMIFVIQDKGYNAPLIEFLESEYNESEIVKIPKVTKGALLSASAGLSLISDYDEIICVDLVDITFSMKRDILPLMFNNLNISGLIPYFKSQKEQFSYLSMSEQGHVERVVEKKVISENASAGVYFYKNMSKILQSVKYSVDNSSSISYRNNLFVAPSFNGLIDNSDVVLGVEVHNVNEISLLFK